MDICYNKQINPHIWSFKDQIFESWIYLSLYFQIISSNFPKSLKNSNWLLFWASPSKTKAKYLNFFDTRYYYRALWDNWRCPCLKILQIELSKAHWHFNQVYAWPSFPYYEFWSCIARIKIVSSFHNIWLKINLRIIGIQCELFVFSSINLLV